MMNGKEKEILEYLERCYDTAKYLYDSSSMIRINRAIAAFKTDPVDAPESIFTKEFLKSYSMK